MPPLLCVNVRRAIVKGPGSVIDSSSSPIQFNTFVQLKLHNLTIHTRPVKGLNPSWEQRFLFQTAGHETGLLVELWNKGALWNKLLGCVYITLDSVAFKPTEQPQLDQLQDGALAGSPDYLQGTWYFLDTEVLYDDRNQILGTARNTVDQHMLLIACHFEPSIYELGVDQYHLGQQQQQTTQSQNDSIGDANQLNLPTAHSFASGTNSSQRLRSPYLLDAQSSPSPFAQLAVAAVAEAERTGTSPTVATCSTMPTATLYKTTVDRTHLNQFVSSSENERSDQVNQITSTESDSQEDEQLEELATRFRTKRGISLLDELIMANDTATEWLLDQLCALDSDDDDDLLDGDQLDSEDDLLLLDGKLKFCC